MCKHLPRCPDALAPDRKAARIQVSHPEQGWSLLCNGVILFDDAGVLVPRQAGGGGDAAAHGSRHRCTTESTGRRAKWAKKRAEWAQKNSAYLHRLLTERQPGYLAALRSAERQVDLELSTELAGAGAKARARAGAGAGARARAGATTGLREPARPETVKS